jgi:hypothetical protein
LGSTVDLDSRPPSAFAIARDRVVNETGRAASRTITPAPGFPYSAFARNTPADSPKHSIAALVAFVISLSATSNEESFNWIPIARLFWSSPVIRNPSKPAVAHIICLNGDACCTDDRLTRLLAYEVHAIL